MGFSVLSSPRTGAADRNRTRNLLFTKQLLCQLSYGGVVEKSVAEALAPTEFIFCARQLAWLEFRSFAGERASVCPTGALNKGCV
jgi:hypothetical protein